LSEGLYRGCEIVSASHLPRSARAVNSPDWNLNRAYSARYINICVFSRENQYRSRSRNTLAYSRKIIRRVRFTLAQINSRREGNNIKKKKKEKDYTYIRDHRLCDHARFLSRATLPGPKARAISFVGSCKKQLFFSDRAFLRKYEVWNYKCCPRFELYVFRSHSRQKTKQRMGDWYTRCPTAVFLHSFIEIQKFIKKFENIFLNRNRPFFSIQATILIRTSLIKSKIKWHYV